VLQNHFPSLHTTRVNHKANPPRTFCSLFTVHSRPIHQRHVTIPAWSNSFHLVNGTLLSHSQSCHINLSQELQKSNYATHWKQILNTGYACRDRQRFSIVLYLNTSYSAPSRFLFRGAPDYCTDAESEFHAEANEQLRVKDLPRVPMRRLLLGTCKAPH